LEYEYVLTSGKMGFKLYFGIVLGIFGFYEEHVQSTREMRDTEREDGGEERERG
jgi:hypothetical protein